MSSGNSFMRACLLSIPVMAIIFAAEGKQEVCSLIDTQNIGNRPNTVVYSNLKIIGLDRVNKDVIINLLVFHRDGKLDIDESKRKSCYRKAKI